MVDDDDFDSAAALGELRGLADRYGVPFDIEAVPSIQLWCTDHGLVEENPFRSGAVFRNSENGRYLVLLANPITSGMIGSAIGGMIANGLDTSAESLREPRQFARHLLLHEVAHALDGSRSETQCDKWAFREMGINCAV